MEQNHRILILAYDGGQLLDIAGPQQMFAGANDALGRPQYRIEIAAGRSSEPLATSSGLRLLPDRALQEVSDRVLAEMQTILVAGGSPGLEPALEDGAITEILRRADGVVPRIASICTGAFFLAEAGLLDGRRATTHWDSVEKLQSRYPAVAVEPDAIFVCDGAIWSSAGVTAGIDLALAMIEADLDRETALAVARRHVVSRMRSGGQSQYSADLIGQSAETGPLHGLVARIQENPSEDWSIERLSEAANMSLRTLSRRFRERLRLSPAQFVERIRVDAARRALLETDLPVSAVADRAGFGSLRRMDRAFERLIGVSPSDFRRSFQTPSQVHQGGRHDGA